MLAASPENSSSSYDPMPPGFDSRYAQTAAISETSTQTVSLSDDYLLSLNDEPLLFNKKNIIWDVIQSIMANSSQSSTPLLVGEPIHSKNSRVDQYFEFLSRRGIELNRISSDGLILKSIPTFLERAPYGNLVSYLVSLLEESSPEDLNLDKILSSELLSIFDNKSWDELVSIDNIRSSGVLIDQSKLERLYHEDR
jgi:DNA mismatch repair ATPase MutL